MAVFSRDTAGIGEILKSQGMRDELRRVARQMAAQVESETGRPVEITDGTTDRASVSVTIADPAGSAIQAKHGPLTRAAMTAGLDVGA